MTIVIFAMNQKGFAVVEWLLQAHPTNLMVVGARDSNVQRDFYEEIKGACHGCGVQFLDRSEAKGLVAEHVIAVGWRWIIRDCRELIVFHDSLLPRYRGFAPLPTALLNGDDEVGVTALFGDDDYDCGDIIAQKRLHIRYPVKVQEVIDLITPLYTELADEIVNAILAGSPLKGIPQDEATASYSPWRDEDDYRVDWSRDAREIKRFIDAVGYPYNGASSEVGGSLVRILDASVEPEVKIEQRVPGKVTFIHEGLPIVACGTGMLRLLDVRDGAGSSLMPLAKFRSRFK